MTTWNKQDLTAAEQCNLPTPEEIAFARAIMAEKERNVVVIHGDAPKCYQGDTLGGSPPNPVPIAELIESR